VTRRSKLTAKSLGLADDVRLSDSFANTRDHYKVVTDRVLSYRVGGSDRNGWQVTPMLDAMIYIKSKGTWHVVSSYEHGEPLVVRKANGFIDRSAYTFAETIVKSISALEQRTGEVREEEKRFTRGAKKGRRS
jgi:hypothetical protein